MTPDGRPVPDRTSGVTAFKASTGSTVAVRRARRWLAHILAVPGTRSAPANFGNIVPGVFTPVLAKHSDNFPLEESLAIGVDRMQRNFAPMRRQVEEWRASRISTTAAKLIIYQAFVESELEAPKHLARRVHDLYFRPTHPEFEPRTLWSLSNAFTNWPPHRLCSGSGTGAKLPFPSKIFVGPYATLLGRKRFLATPLSIRRREKCYNPF